MAIVLIAGAMIVDTMMRLKPVAERTSVTVHFVTLEKSLGLVWEKRSTLWHGELQWAFHLLCSVERLIKSDQVWIVYLSRLDLLIVCHLDSNPCGLDVVRIWPN